MPPTTPPSSQCATPTTLLAELPLPWTIVCDPACARIVAANDATVLACSPDEANIAGFVTASVNARSTALLSALNTLATVLTDVDGYPTDGDFVDALILSAESVVRIAKSGG